MCAYIISVRSLFSMKNISQERKDHNFSLKREKKDAHRKRTHDV